MKPPYSKVLTQDGSPTLLWAKNDELSEYMHHSGGALSESLYIYHEALVEAKRRGWPARIFSLGLGLGYNEMIALAELGDVDFKIWSFEAIPVLREGFRAWSEGRARELAGTFADVANLIAAEFKISAEELRTRSARALEDGRLELHDAYPGDPHIMSGVTCVFYDAYSNKMSPELWGESEMLATLAPILAQKCVFATYAATGALNRVLKTLGFKVEKKRGFASKRENTFAIREKKG